MILTPPVRGIDTIADTDEMEIRMKKIREINVRRVAAGGEPLRPADLEPQQKNRLNPGW